MNETTKIKWGRRGFITLGILLILAALNYYPWGILFHKYGAIGLAHEEFVDKRAGIPDFSEVLTDFPVNDQVPEAIILELEPMQMSAHDLRQVAIVRNLTVRDSRAFVFGVGYYMIQAAMWILAFIGGVKLIRYGRRLHKPSASEKTLEDISTLSARVEELEKRLSR